MRPLLFPLAAFALATLPCPAALLIYEGFTGYGVADLSLATPNDNTIGLAKTAVYSPSASGYTLTAGLTFAGLQSSGQAVTYTNSGTHVASAELLLSSTVADGGTLYGSYLVNTGTKSGSSGNGMEVRIGETTGSSGTRYRSFSDSRASTSEMSVLYSGTDGTTAGSSGVILPAGATFLIVNMFQGVNTPLAVGSPGTAHSFALTEAQLAAARVYPGGEEAYLNAAITNNSLVFAYATSTSTSGNNSLISGDFLQLVKVGSGGTTDEIRYGDTLASVLPVPEPSGALLALLGMGAVAVRRRR